MKISIPIPSHMQSHGGGFEAGLFHPVLGLDHLLAMVAVGIIATRLGSRQVHFIPLLFVSVMFIGSLLGFNKIQFMYDEIGITLSVIILGGMIFLNKSISLYIVILSVSIFAFFHGHAHGVEIPKVSSKESYTLGFVLATTGLHIFGIFLTTIINKTPYARMLFYLIGSSMFLFGVYLLVDII
jgi:urease accessory protein